MKNTRFAAAFAAALVGGVPLHARADCVNIPAFIPGQSQWGPVWLPVPPGSLSTWLAELDDPRWAGGPVHFYPFQQGGSFTNQYDALYRAVYSASGTALDVSLQVVIDPDGPNLLHGDAVYFGITQGTGGSGAYLFEIPPEPTPCAHPISGFVPHDPVFPCPNTTSLINVYSTLDYTVPSPTWTLMPSSSFPGWIHDVATWTGSPGVSWAVTLRVDTSSHSGLPIATQPVQMFFGTRIGSPGTTVALTSSAQADASHPAIGGTPARAVITDWASFDPLGNTCPPAISIFPPNIGVLSSGAMSTTIATCNGCTNTFRVVPSNVPSAIASTPFALRSRVRISDWGSLIGDLNAPWEDIGIVYPNVFRDPASSFLPPTWNYGPAGTSAVNIDFTCSIVSPNTFCPFLRNAVSSQPIQTVLAEIDFGPNVTGATLLWRDAFRDMNYVTLTPQASALPDSMQMATINLQGLPPGPPGESGRPPSIDRDVYLYVETKNMPPVGTSQVKIDQTALTKAVTYATQYPDIPTPGKPAPQSVGDLPLLTGEQRLGEVFPTYRVHPYYDSGRTIQVKGKVQKVLVPMVPFGFYLDHRGPFYGFTHKLDFGNVPYTQLAPNFFVAHTTGGKLQVWTRIAAAEAPPIGAGAPPGGPPPVRCSCDMVRATPWSPLWLGLGGLGVLGLGIRWGMRKRGSKTR